MFGYVRPNRDGLKVRELRDYEAPYRGAEALSGPPLVAETGLHLRR